MRVDFEYVPRGPQKIIHLCLKRFIVLVTHRRMGKTFYAILEILDKALRCEWKAPRYAYIAPTYAQAKRIAWDYLVDFAMKIPGTELNLKDLTVTIPRPWKGDIVRIMLLGSENPDSLRGLYLDGVVMDEYGSMSSLVWPTVIRPSLSDREGWARIIGTPRGRNHFERMYVGARNQMQLENPNWAAFSFKASETGILKPEELAEARMSMSEEEYDQEYECSFSANLIGSYFASYINILEKDNKIRDFDYEYSSPVYTYWDLGMNDLTAIWFYQYTGGEHRFIDYHEDNGKDLGHYVKLVRERPYVYAPSGHVFPFDVRVRELGTGATRLETLEKWGMYGTVPQRRASFEDGIDAGRMLLKQGVYFHKSKCETGLDALRSYQRRYDTKREVWEKGPTRSWANHGADAFKYAALDIQSRSSYTWGTQAAGRSKLASKAKEWDEFAV